MLKCCVCAFSIHRECPDMILGYEPLILEVVLLHRATNSTPFHLFYRAEVVLPEEINHRSLRTTTEILTCPSEAKEKDLLESNRIKVVTNLQKYQDETKAWRDLKVKLWELNLGAWFSYEAPAPRAPANWRPNGLSHT
jgi:hypothetical protein